MRSEKRARRGKFVGTKVQGGVNVEGQECEATIVYKETQTCRAGQMCRPGEKRVGQGEFIGNHGFLGGGGYLYTLFEIFRFEPAQLVVFSKLLITNFFRRSEFVQIRFGRFWPLLG